MKARGILFQAPLVRAILAGTKTQTRRLPNPPMSLTERGGIAWRGCAYGMRTDGSPYLAELLKRCPYGVKGDRLWVRETWALYHDHAAKVGDEEALRDARGQMPWAGVMFRAEANGGHAESHRVGDRWRPAIHLPRWASRITLEITEVRVERLQEISEDDAKAEGVEPLSSIHADQRILGEDRGRTQGSHPHTLALAVLWDTINGDKAPWSSNPWVWALTFKRQEAGGDG